jgi:hypothetical protein
VLEYLALAANMSVLFGAGYQNDACFLHRWLAGWHEWVSLFSIHIFPETIPLWTKYPMHLHFTLVEGLLNRIISIACRERVYNRCFKLFGTSMDTIFTMHCGLVLYQVLLNVTLLLSILVAMNQAVRVSALEKVALIWTPNIARMS